MAQRRMFSPDIVCGEEFSEMPPSSRELYFQLGMRADDDGFIQPKGVIRTLGAKEDDLKILIAKRFVLPFESGVVVIKHWLIHNMIRSDRYKETRFLEEKRALYLKDNKSYTDNPDNGTPLLATKWQPNGNHPAPQVRLGKVSIVSAEEPREEPELPEREIQPKSTAKYPNALEVFKWFPRPQKSWESLKSVQEREYAQYLYKRGEANVKQALRYVETHKDEEFCPKVNKPSDLEKKWLDISDYAKRNR